MTARIRPSARTLTPESPATGAYELGLHCTVMEKQQKLDIARPIASLETWREEAGAILTELKARTGTLERVTLPALDAKLHDEVAARERLEHRARYLPKD